MLNEQVWKFQKKNDIMYKYQKFVKMQGIGTFSFFFATNKRDYQCLNFFQLIKPVDSRNVRFYSRENSNVKDASAKTSLAHICTSWFLIQSFAIIDT